MPTAAAAKPITTSSGTNAVMSLLPTLLAQKIETDGLDGERVLVIEGSGPVRRIGRIAHDGSGCPAAQAGEEAGRPRRSQVREELVGDLGLVAPVVAVTLRIVDLLTHECELRLETFHLGRERTRSGVVRSRPRGGTGLSHGPGSGGVPVRTTLDRIEDAEQLGRVDGPCALLVAIGRKTAALEGTRDRGLGSDDLFGSLSQGEFHGGSTLSHGPGSGRVPWSAPNG